MKTIKLTRQAEAIVDDENYAHLLSYKWYLGHRGYVTSSIDSKGDKKVYMHRVILNATEGEEVDHINHNKLDNRKENLRIATRVQNARNRVACKNCKSGYKGVTKKGNSFCASISFNGKQIHIGYYKTKEQAAAAYNTMAIKLHNEFACLNNVKGGQHGTDKDAQSQ